MRQLLEAGVHFGHQTRYWSPKMAPYIFGKRDKIHIINLEKTLPMMHRANDYLGQIAANGGKILFVGTKRQAGPLVRQHAQRCGAAYVDRRWLGGMLTNYKTVKNSISRLKELERTLAVGEDSRLSKKETLELERDRVRLDKTLSGIKEMDGLPDALFVIDVEQEYIAVAEAIKLGIPVVAVVDTNCSPQDINYIIPGNDDSAKAIALYLEAAADTILAARTKAEIAAAKVAATDDQPAQADAKAVSADKAAAPTTPAGAPPKQGDGTKEADSKPKSPPPATLDPSKITIKKTRRASADAGAAELAESVAQASLIEHADSPEAEESASTRKKTTLTTKKTAKKTAKKGSAKTTPASKKKTTKKAAAGKKAVTKKKASTSKSASAATKKTTKKTAAKSTGATKTAKTATKKKTG